MVDEPTGTHANMFCKHSGSIYETRRAYLGGLFAKCVVVLYLLILSVGSSLAVNDLIMPLGSLIMGAFGRNALLACLGVPGTVSYITIMRKCYLVYYGNALPLFTVLKACGRWGHVFATSSNTWS